MTRSICTSTRIRDFFDDLALISAAHGAYLEGDVVRWIMPSEKSRRFSGYVAQICDSGDWEWWAFGGIPGTTMVTDRRVRSLDVSRFSAHQRLTVAGSLLPLRESFRQP